MEHLHIAVIGFAMSILALCASIYQLRHSEKLYQESKKHRQHKI